MGFTAYYLIFFAVIFIICIAIEIILMVKKKYKYAIAGAIAIVIWTALLFFALSFLISNMCFIVSCVV